MGSQKRRGKCQQEASRVDVQSDPGCRDRPLRQVAKQGGGRGEKSFTSLPSVSLADRPSKTPIAIEVEAALRAAVAGLKTPAGRRAGPVANAPAKGARAKRPAATSECFVASIKIWPRRKDNVSSPQSLRGGLLSVIDLDSLRGVCPIFDHVLPSSRSASAPVPFAQADERSGDALQLTQPPTWISDEHQ